MGCQMVITVTSHGCHQRLSHLSTTCHPDNFVVVTVVTSTTMTLISVITWELSELSLWQFLTTAGCQNCHIDNYWQLSCNHRYQSHSCRVTTVTTLTTLKLSIGDNSMTIRWQLYDIPSFCVICCLFVHLPFNMPSFINNQNCILFRYWTWLNSDISSYDMTSMKRFNSLKSWYIK